MAECPGAKFRLEPGGHEDIWHLSVYGPDDNLRLPLTATEYLNQVWREHKITIITTVYHLDNLPERADGDNQAL